MNGTIPMLDALWSTHLRAGLGLYRVAFVATAGGTINRAARSDLFGLQG